MTAAIRLDDDSLTTMERMYLGGTSLRDIACIFGFSRAACTRMLRERGIRIRGIGRARRYSVDETFFDAIDSEAKAYWLGFLTADGIVYRTHVQIALHDRDADHLNKFAAALRSEHPVKRMVTGDGYHRAVISIGSSHMVGALERLGVTRNKTFTGRPYTQLSDDLLPHYWRGVLDGDGHIRYTQERARLKWRVGLAGNEYMTLGFMQFVAKIVDSRIQCRPMGSIFMVEYSGNRVVRAILGALYGAATV